MRILSLLSALLFCTALMAADGVLESPIKDALALGNKKFQSCSGNHWKKNEDAPKRGKTGRISSRAFFQKYPDHELEITELGIVPDAHFGTFKPGDKFGNSWIVRAKGEPVGINHKSATWVKAVIECMGKDGKTVETVIKPDRGCGCGGTSDWFFNVPYSAPSGKHTVKLTWEYPKMTSQKLTREYTVEIINDSGNKGPDSDLPKLIKKHGEGNVMVFRNGAQVNGETYAGVDDMTFSYGGYENDRTSIISPQSNRVDVGYWIVNRKASFYARGLFRFNLDAIKGKKVKAAYLKLSIKQNQKYLPPVLKQSFPIYAMKKTWKEGQREKKYHVDKRGLSEGMPNYLYQAYPTKWTAHLASSDEDRTKQYSELVIDPEQLQIPGARADVTQLVQEWVSGELENNGFLIGKDLPKELNNVHPGLDGKVDEYKKLYNGGAVPFISSDEPIDTAFTPRLIVVLD